MNDELRLIRHLYGEAEAPEALADDEALRGEYEQLRRVRDVLDARPAVRPSDGVLDRVMEAASSASGSVMDGAEEEHATQARSSTARQDRPPVAPPSQRWTRLLSVGGALALVLLAVIVGHDSVVQDESTAVGDAQEQVAEAPEPVQEPAQAPVAAPQLAARGETSADLEEEVVVDASVSDEAASNASRGEVPEELLAWDAPQAEVFEAYRRVQVLEARSRAEGLQPAGTRRTVYD